MGSYTFRWEQPAEEAFVTGSFDNWSKSVKLDKKDTGHEKTVSISNIDHAITYKYFVDGAWQLDNTKKLERDHEGNLNNVLYPEEVEPPLSMASTTISSVAPGASTTDMAGAQPLEDTSREHEEMPGAFPETPALESLQSKEHDSNRGLFSSTAAEPSQSQEHDSNNGLLAGAAAAGAGAVAAIGGTFAALTGGSSKKQDDQTFSVNPIPASEGSGNPISLAPGEKVPDLSSMDNTVASSVRVDKESYEKGVSNTAPIGSPQTSLENETSTLSDGDTDRAYGVAPIPASGGIGNPVHLQPGESVPDATTVTGNSLTSNVKLDKESYEKGVSNTAPIGSPQTSLENDASTLSGLGPQTTNMIPESSMGMGNDTPAPLEGAALSSVGANSTTNQLAGQVPLEPRGVPEVVAESQKDANADPEASANPSAVEEKKEMEEELKSKIPEEQAGSENDAGAYGAGAGGSAITGAAMGANSTTNQLAGQVPLEPRGVPEVVAESQKDANAAPEASANPDAVEEKSEMEQELKSKVPEEQAGSEGTSGGNTDNGNENRTGMYGAIAGGLAATGAAVAGAAVVAREKMHETTGTDPVSVLPTSMQQSINSTQQQSGASSSIPREPQQSENSSAVPTEVKESQREANVDPEASSNAAAVQEKSVLEQELLQKVPETQATGEPAPTATAATSSFAPTMSSSGAQQSEASSAVPTEVKESQREAHVDPEASSNAAAVQEKSVLEQELLQKVPETQATGEPAPTATAATSTFAPTTSSSGAPQLGGPIGGGFASSSTEEKSAVSSSTAAPPMYLSGMPQLGAPIAGGVTSMSAGDDFATTSRSVAPMVSSSGAPQLGNPVTGDLASMNMEDKIAASAPAVASTTFESGAPQLGSPMASTSNAPVDSNSMPPMASTSTPAVASTAIPAIAEPQPVASSSGLNAPASAPAQTPATKSAVVAESAGTAGTQKSPIDSRDVSPMSRPAAGQPIVTTGTSSAPLAAAQKAAATTTSPPAATPTNKRNSFSAFMRNQPSESPKTTSSEGKKKKGFLAKLKEKLKN